MKSLDSKLERSIFQSSSGLTLVEVVITAAISGILLLLVAVLTLRLNRSTRNTMQVENFNHLVAIVQTLIGNPTQCAKLFRGLPYPPPAPGLIDPSAPSGSNIPCLTLNGLLSPSHSGGDPRGGCPPNPVHPAPFFDNANAQGVILLSNSQYKNIFIEHINFTLLPDYLEKASSPVPPLVSLDARAPFVYKTYIANLSIHAQKFRPSGTSSPLEQGLLGLNDMTQNFPLSITTVSPITTPPSPDLILSCEKRFPTSMTGPLCQGLGAKSFDQANSACIFN